MSDNSPVDSQKAAALFANMIVQQTNMALIFLGHTPNPQTGEMIEDLDTARMLIDQLEMLALKTRGNLDPRETALMNQSLTAVRMAFVEAVEKGPKLQKPTDGSKTQPEAPKKDEVSPGAPEGGEPSESASAAPVGETGAAAAQDESRKKFSKKY